MQLIRNQQVVCSSHITSSNPLPFSEGDFLIVTTLPLKGEPNGERLGNKTQKTYKQKNHRSTFINRWFDFLFSVIGVKDVRNGICPNDKVFGTL